MTRSTHWESSTEGNRCGGAALLEKMKVLHQTGLSTLLSSASLCQVQARAEIKHEQRGWIKVS